MTNNTTERGFFSLKRKIQIEGEITFTTPWRIGSGREGDISDLGVLLSPTGEPVLPGSSLKGVLRSTCERLAYVLGLEACQLDSHSAGLSYVCSSDVKAFTNWKKEHQKEWENLSGLPAAERLDWIAQHTCDVCRLFGSPLMKSVLKISDGRLSEWAGVVEVRDSVVLDRDSKTSRNKFDFDVVPPAKFAIRLDLDNPTDADLALLGAGLFEWTAGVSIGGFTSRGLGQAELTITGLRSANLSDPKEQTQYLLGKTAEEKLTLQKDWEGDFQEFIEKQLKKIKDQQETQG